MSKKNKAEHIGNGRECPKCGKPMERREHKNIGAKQLNKTYYYREWDYCQPCGHLQHYEEYKVFSKNYKKLLTLVEEDEQHLKFIGSI